MIKQKFIIEPHFLFLLLSLVAGLICVFFIPVGLGFDEKAHTRRIWEISGGTFMPNFLAEKIKTFPTSMEDKLSVPPFFDDPSHTIFGADLTQRINWWEMGDGKTSSSYFPTLYILPSLVMSFFGRNFNIPMMVLFYLLRIACLLAFVIPAYFAIRIIPHSKWLFMGLALIPMSVLQSGTISPEGMSNGLAFLFIAWIIRFSEQQDKLTNRKIGLLLLMTAILFTLKINLAFLLVLLLLVSKSLFHSKKQLAVVLISIVILFILIVLGWNYFTASSLPYNGNTPGEVISQVKFIATKPFSYLGILLKDLKLNGGRYLLGWIAVFPTQNLYFPYLIHIFSGITILFFILFDPSNQRISIKKRIILLTAGILGYILTITVLFIKDAPVGSQSVLRVQGRYFIAVFPLLLLGFTTARIKMPLNVFKPIAIGLVSIIMIMFSTAVILRYTTACGLSIMTGSECYRPNYRNWAPNTAYTDPIVQGITVRQSILVDCNNFNSLQIWSDRGEGISDGATTITVVDMALGDVVTGQVIPNLNFSKQNWTTIFFPQVPDSTGKRYMVLITSPVTQNENAVKLSLSYRQEYLDGDLLINEQPVDTDLIFQFGCCVKPFCPVINLQE